MRADASIDDWRGGTRNEALSAGILFSEPLGADCQIHPLLP
jgi:hypothetical protein